LDETVVGQLNQKDVRSVFPPMFLDIIEGKPRSVDPSPPLPQQLGQRCHWIDIGLHIRQVMKIVIQSVNPET
jgi:hypothetical protein